MGKTVKNIGYLVLFSGMFLILIYCIQPAIFNSFKPGDCNQALGDLLNQLEDKSISAPAGEPALGTLRWENESQFLALCGEYGAILRMAAFKIILPDPLPGEKHNVALAADLLAGKIVPPGGYFSLNNSIGPYTRERGFKEGQAFSGSNVFSSVGGGVCKVATTLYNTAVLANLKILERHPHSMLVPYVPPGRDATVSYGFIDLSFNNNTGSPLIIWADTEGNTLTVAIYGSTFPPKVTWHHELLSWQKRPTVYRNNPSLPSTKEKVIMPGADSVRVKTWLTVESTDGTKVKRDLGIDYYNPMARIIEKKL